MGVFHKETWPILNVFIRKISFIMIQKFYLLTFAAYIPAIPWNYTSGSGDLSLFLGAMLIFCRNIYEKYFMF